MIRREDLARAFNGDHRLIAHFEQQADTVEATAGSASDTAAATELLQDATVIVLSSNNAFTNERVLKRGAGIRMFDTGEALIVELTDVLKPLASPETLPDYADDTAAAAGGIAVGSFYRTASSIKVRIA